MRKTLFGMCLLLAASLIVRAAPDATNAPTTLEGFLRLYAYFPYPFEQDDEDPFVLRARIGGKSVRLLVDTGAEITTMDPRSTPGAKTLGELHETLHDSLLGEITEPSVLLIDDLAFGPARFFHQPARAAKLETHYVALPFDGILGVDFLYRNFCVIDCAGRQIYFRAAKPTAEQEKGIDASLRGSGYTPVPFSHGLTLIVQGKTQGKRTDWIVDTGSRYTFLEESERSRLKLKRERYYETGSRLPKDVEYRAIGLQRIGLGDRHMTVTQAKELSFGREKWQDAYIGIVDMKMADLHRPEKLGPDVHGFAGADFLLIHGALIDFSTDTIWFPPQPKT